MGCFFPLGGSQLVRLAPVACVTITVQVAVFAAEIVAFVCDFGAVAPLMVIRARTGIQAEAVPSYNHSTAGQGTV